MSAATTKGAAYRAGRIKRTRRTREQVEQLRRQIEDVLREDHPQSVRHVFYRMTDPRLPEPVEKSERGYEHVQHQLAEMRRSGRIPYGWISDDTRRGYHVPTFSGCGDFLTRMSGLYRADLWEIAERHVEVWTESRSIASVIQPTCEELAVSLYPAGGFTSLTLTHQAAQYIAQVGKPATIFYIGDLDPAGVLIDRDIETRLRAHLGDEIELEFVRLGITADQVEEYDLPTKPRKAGEKRAPELTCTVEAEAMPAQLLRGLLRERIEELIPEGALEAARVAEASERDGLRRLADLGSWQ